MDVVSIFISIVRKSGVFVLVLTVLGLIARIEPQQPEPHRVAPMAKVAKPKPAAPSDSDSKDWYKGPGWRRNG